MTNPPNSKKPPRTDRDPLKRLNEIREASPKLPSPNKVFIFDFGLRPEPPRPSDLSGYQRWNNLCAALAEDTLLDKTPLGRPDDVDRIRKRIAQLIECHRHGD